MKPIRVVVVDDSTFVREGLVRLLDDPRIEVVGTAATGEELLSNLDEWQPDVISLDLVMPGMGGMAALERVMAQRPTPVIILSSHSGEGAPLTVEALSLGAVDCIDKEAYSLLDFQGLRSVLLDRILAVAHSNVSAPTVDTEASAEEPSADTKPAAKSYDLALFGASTGGPRAIEQVLTGLGSQLVAPIAIVQHMPKGFTNAFAARLDRALPLTVKEASNGDPLKPGTVHIAPAGQHLRIAKKNGAFYASLGPMPSDSTHRPSIDVLFGSAAQVAGDRTVAVILTGMGKDGAEGMAMLRAAGAHTIAQSAPSCVVYGMPKAAIALEAVQESLPLDKIAARVSALLRPA